MDDNFRVISRPRLRPAHVLAFAAVLTLAGCASDLTVPAVTRSYRMGFTQIPPSADPILGFQSLEMWTRRADAGLILGEPPWDSLLAGIPADVLASRDALALATYYRAKGLRVWVSVDPTNGLDRSSDAAPLVAAGRSLVEPAIQQLFRDWVTAVDTLLHPDYLGVASETNLVRAAAPAALYGAVVQVAAVPRMHERVLLHLFADADGQGLAALQGRMRHALVEPLWRLGARLDYAHCFTLVHSREPAVYAALNANLPSYLEAQQEAHGSLEDRREVID